MPVPPQPALTRQARYIAAASLAVSIAIGLALAQLRAGIPSAFTVPIYSHLVLFHDYFAVIPFVAVLLIALLPSVRSAGLRTARWCGHHVWLLAAFTLVALVAGSHLVYHAYPLSLDEHTVVFQSEVFAAGHLTGRFPPDLVDWLLPGFFQGRFFAVSYPTGEVVSAYWPGFALLLAPYTALGAPWLLNPLIGAATVVVMHRLGLALFGNVESAGLVALLTLASPAVTINALSYYSMPAHLLANAMFMLLLLDPTPRRAAAAGLVGSLALVLHNPVPHLLFALPWFVWLALRPGRWRLIGALIAGYLPLCIALGWGWSLFIEGVKSAAAASALSLPERAVAILMQRLAGVLDWSSSTGASARLLDLAKLWLWACPALIAAAALGAWRTGRSPGPWATLAGSALLTYFGYFVMHFDQGHGWGYRYFHSAWLALPLFAVAASGTAGDRGQVPDRASLAGYLAACALIGSVALTALHAVQVERFIARHLAQQPAATDGEPQVLIVNGRSGYYSWDLVRNDPFLRDPVIVMLSRGDEADAAMMAAHYPRLQRLAADARGSVWGLAGGEGREAQRRSY